MKQSQILEFAIKGIGAEIAEYEAKKLKASNILKDIEEMNGNYKGKLKANEVRELYVKYHNKIEELDEQRFDLRWKLSEIEENEK